MYPQTGNNERWYYSDGKGGRVEHPQLGGKIGKGKHERKDSSHVQTVGENK